MVVAVVLGGEAGNVVGAVVMVSAARVSCAVDPWESQDTVIPISS